jgi:NAD(P)-dependent dehydrogenase (short-subunit alcohol dehydrogenase family)
MASKRVEQIAAHLNYPKGMLAGQVAIITGSGQGIGAEAARLFANEGAKVVVSDIDGSKLDTTGLTNPNVRLTMIPLHRESTAGRR